MKKINKKMSFSEIMKANPEAPEVLMKEGMFCCGCPMSMQESLEQGAAAHGIDADKIVEKLNKEKIKKKK